ncbi:MAG TPA: TIGR02680 family protein [Trebonia sp.]|nr:TIGR02680 family protein [Trebonia sp.]
MLPAPSSERWKPLRAGLVDMFYYDQEEFWFHDGRLLLRGNNGTGKSKVLALTLPFLLDGDLAPHRVEPDGDRQKRMEWNLLLGGKHPSPERLGYTWLEFGRRSADGTQEFWTIGCGLKAVAGRGIARHWFFVTSQRPGTELRLLPDSRVPLTREKLREEIGERGFVFDRAADYRRAVDEHLFGLGLHRYEALVNLLIQLRQPQLSKKPDEKLLSRALTEALPPLSPGLVTTVADAFRGLDEERNALRSLAEAQQAATDFLSHYRRYAKAAAKRKAAGPRLTQSRYEQLRAELAAAEEAFTAAQHQLAEAETELGQLEEQRSELETRQTALQADPAMRDAERLEQLRQDAERREQTAQDREDDRNRHAGHARRYSDKAAETAHRAGAGRDKLAQALRESATTAAVAGCARQHQAAVAPLHGAGPDQYPAAEPADGAHQREASYLDAAEAPATDILARARRDAGVVADRQEQAVARLGKLLEDSAEHARKLHSAQVEEGRLSAEVQAAADRVATADQAVAERMRLLVDGFRSYLSGLTELRVADGDELIAALESWGVTAEGANPAVAVIDDATRAAGAELGRLAGELSSQRTRQLKRASELAEEIGRLRDGGHDAPPVPSTRAPGSRDGRPGAPLWKVTEFAPGLADDKRAGLEAALEASGILDAWVTPDGTLVDGDVIVASGLAPVAGESCANLLVPAIDADDHQAGALRAQSVAAVLSAIGTWPQTAGGGAAWVTTDGRWSNGVLSGAWRKDQAGYIGEGAREAARRTRIRVLERELDQERAAIEEIEAGLTDIEARQELLADEHRTVPPDDGVREAHTLAAGERRRRAELREDLAQAVALREQRQGELTAAQARAADFAVDVGLPADTGELALVRDGLGAYRVALAALWPAAEAAHTAIRAAADAETEVAQSRQLLVDASERAADARETAGRAATTYQELLATVGTAVEELQRRLAEATDALGRNQVAHAVARGRERDAIGASGKADGERGRLRADVETATAQRDVAVREFQAFAATGLLRVAVTTPDIPGTDEPWAATPTVILARAVNAELESVDDGDGPWDRIQKRVTEEHKLLGDAMARHGHSAGLTLSEGVIVIDVVFQGRSHDLPQLAGALSAEVEQRTMLLSAREQEILENHLLNEVAGTLQELISEAEAEVRQMNDELESRPTSTGMKLRLIWQQARNSPEGLDRVRLKLRQTIDAWSAADRTLVGAFLQQRIAAEHADNPAAGWAETLTSALDYRGWHEFVIQRYQDGQWRPATGPASGGERALVVSVPLFAAASSHYKSAGNPHAPRLIALDEAFAGVDDDSRAKCLGLLATFDMDVVMTSEREWGCYPQVPGLGICQLARQDGVDAVLVTPWRWDGRERRRADQAVV